MLSVINWIVTNIPPWVFIALVTFAVVMGSVAYMILLERKVASWAQDRLGPNRVGPMGLLQPIADGLKFLFKEDYRPAGADARLFTLAPIIMMIVMIVSIGVIPWGGVYSGAGGQFDFQIAKLNIGVLFVIISLSLGVYGVVLGGWASNNKYSFLGGMRAAAQMISYEIPLGLSLLCVVLMYGTLDLGIIVEKQAHYWLGVIPAWNIFSQPLAFVLFLICIHAEANRSPFDLAECEQELVGGYHTEYSSMRFALFFLAEYAGMITTSAVCVALFLGGWHFWGLTGTDSANPAVTSSPLVIALRCLVFYSKTMAVVFVFMWVRWSLPRFRFDQLMLLAWRGLIPMSLGLLMMTGLMVYYVAGATDAYRQTMQLDGLTALIFLAMNCALAAGAMGLRRLLPVAPPVNRRVRVENSRFNGVE
jgi:NADH-quinone oxidoreductase subunit H